MFRNFLSEQIDKKRIAVDWIKKIDGLIRVVIYDTDNTRAFVVVYYEKKREYSVISFNAGTGEIYWTKNVVNGGYGAPALLNDLVIVPLCFTNIVALSKDDGREIWQVETKWRVRSPVNAIDGKVYFSSGGTVFEVNSNGYITHRWDATGAFFYGAIDVFQELIITLGTIEDEAGESTACVFAFHKNGGVAYTLPICKAPVISSDTSGISWSGDTGFVGGNDIILCFRGNDGKVVWTSKINGFAGRQLCSVDERRVYYVTQSGEIGALNIADGSPVWSISTNDMTIASPVSIAGDHLIFLADAHLNVLKSANGQLVQKIPVGHSPYSMVSLKGEYGLLGAGEPPHNGLLFGLKFLNPSDCEKYVCSVNVSNAFVESKFVNVLVNIYNADHEILSARLDCAVFNSDSETGERVEASTFAFKVPIPSTMSSGDFVVPLYLNLLSGECLTRPILIRLEKRNPLPIRAYLNNIPDIIQERPTYSGAAIGAAIKKMHGDSDISQSNVREMIDFSLDKSGYEPFQTWRIILRRILTSKARKKEQLPEFYQKIADKR